MTNRVITIDDCKILAASKGGKFLSKKYINSKTRYEWECSKGHKWKVSHSTVVQGSWCPWCAGQRITVKDCKELAKSLGGKFLSKKYINQSTKYLWRCPNGHEWESTYKRVKRGSWCLKCHNETRRNGLQQCINHAKTKNGKCLSDTYINAHQKMKWKCENGHTFASTFHAAKNKNTWCAQCVVDSRKLSIQECKEFALAKGGKCLSDTYTNGITKLLWECSKGHRWEARYTNVKNAGKWCKKCSFNIPDIDDCKKFAEQLGGKLLTDHYTTARTNMLWECDKGHQWEATWDSVGGSRGTWCSKCSSGKTQRELFDIIKNIYPTKQHEFNWYGFDWLLGENGRKLEIDIWTPELKLAIEYDGQQHFYPVIFGGMSSIAARKNFKAQKVRDKIKNNLISQHPEDIDTFVRIPYTEEISENNIKTIIEHNWNNNRNK